MEVFATRKVTALSRALPKLTLKYRQAVRIMKITGILLLAACMQVSANGLTQTITLNVKEASIQEVMRSIEKQTDYVFFYRSEWVKYAKKVTIAANNVPLLQVLELCFKSQPFAYSISGRYITIIPKKNESAESNLLFYKPTIDIRGKVINENGEPMQVSISIKGTSNGTTTNLNGEFQLSNLDDNATLIISGVGIEQKELKLDGLNHILITVKIAIKPLDEVQMVAYGTTTKRFNTGNISSVKAAEIERQPVNNPLLALQGRVTGLVITQNTGLPGGGVTVRIQGQNSITKGNDPLYVIDGIPYTSQLLPTGQFATILGKSGSPNTAVFGNPLSFINPATIESIEVLKDADATAIYGSRAANGAILITTKKGRAGKMKLDVNLQTGIGKLTRRIDLLNTEQYLEMRREAKKNDNATISSSDYDMNGVWDTTRYTDWQKELLGNTARYNDAQVNVSGGSPSTKYLVGMGYHRETIVFPGKFSDQKFSINFNLNTTSMDQKFKMGLSGSYLFDNNKLPDVDLTQTAIRLSPNAPNPLNPDGTLNWAPNAAGNSTWPNGLHPLGYLANSYNVKAYNLLTNLNLSYQLFKGLELKTNVGYTDLRNDELYLGKLAGVAREMRQFFLRSGDYVDNRVSTWIAEPQITYNTRLYNGKIELLIGSTFQQTISKNEVLEGQGFISDEVLKDIKAAPSITALVSTLTNYKYNAIFARAKYNLNDKYILNLTGRRDGSSRFGSANQFHNFGSVGAAWIFSNERFAKSASPIFSFGKLRGSYGATGNDQIGDYEFMTLYTGFSPAPQVAYQNVPGLRPSRLTNPLLQWEETKKLQFGLDLGFLNDQILFSTNYFRNRSSNQLLNYALPSMTGFAGITTNFPAVIQNSGWELALNTTLKRKTFNWEMNFNFTIPKNELVAFPNLESSTYASTLVVGQPVSVIRAFRYTGVDPATGAPQFLNASGNLTLSPANITDQTALINILPKYYGGVGSTFSYKGIRLDILFQFVKQLGSNWHFGSFQPGGLFANQPVTVLNRWQKTGDETEIQRYNSNFSLRTLLTNLPQIDAGYSDASFVRLKNLSLAWTLPEALQRRISFANLTVFIHGQNLLTITKYEGLDPETRSNGIAATLPPLAVFTFGIKAGL